MERTQFEGVRRGIAMTATASLWVMVVSTVERWHTPPIVALSAVIFLLGAFRLVVSAVELAREPDFFRTSASPGLSSSQTG